jgi:hypothetical protein
MGISMYRYGTRHANTQLIDAGRKLFLPMRQEMDKCRVLSLSGQYNRHQGELRHYTH